MKVNYFDLGLYKGVELGWMVNHILPSLGVDEFKACGLEASAQYATYLAKIYQENPKVSIDHIAIADKEEKIKLYHSPNLLGHSIYSTKNNVLQDRFEEVDGMRFSQWIKKANIDLKSSFNIMKVNIEGAEWPLFKDLVENDLVKYFDIFCGAGHDVEKIGEFENIVDDYYSLLEKNNIVIHRFTEWKPHLNKNIRQMIFEKYPSKKYEEIKKIPDIADTVVYDNYKKLWTDVSKPVQLKKAKNHNLSSEQTQKALDQLIKRPAYLCDIVKLFGSKNIVEVGTAQGLQSFSFGEYLRENNIDGSVWTCDVIDVRNQQYVNTYKDRVNFCLGNSESLAKKLEAENTKIDLFYIDGAHGSGDVIRDVYFLKKLQSEHPVWIFDDFDQRFGCYNDILAIMKIAKKFKVYSVGNTASGNPNHQVIIYGKL
jgi:hypothetical protein